MIAAIVLFCSGQVDGQLTFVDKALETGTTNLSWGRGSAMFDLDGDGLLDLIAGNVGMPCEFLRQLPDHTFQSVNTEWGIAFDDRAHWGVLVADFDNDGDPDVYIINGGFVEPQANQLLRNDLNTTGIFTDVSDRSGDGAMVSMNFGGTALDYDRDGNLDIFLTTVPGAETCILLRNDGELIFTDVSSSAGLVDTGQFRHCTSGDYNNDGWIDIAVGNYVGANLLYKNNGDGTFVNVAASAGTESPDDSFGVVLEDFDNDGWMDMFVPKFQVVPTGPSELFRNNGDGTFTNVTEDSGMTGQTDMGHNTGDLDADGYPDIFIGTGRPAFGEDDVLFLVTPDGEGGFLATDVSEKSGITSNGPTRCHGIVIGDYDQDGFVDVYVNNGGRQGDQEALQENFLWQNQGNSNRWMAIRLTGVISNRTAVGARCVATTNTGREIHRYLRVGSGFANTDSPILHFGIGSDQSVDRLDITWPSGIHQTLLDPPMSEITDVVEPVDSCPADLDNSGDVGVKDLLFLLGAWGPCPKKGDCPADFDNSGDVGVKDLLFLLGNWGPCP